MKATDSLKREHQSILNVIAASEKEVAYIEKTGKIHVQTVQEMADFFKNFVERCHHVKEDNHLFVIIHRRGMPVETGPLATIIREHDQCRAYVNALNEALNRQDTPDTASILKAKKNLAAYSKLLRAHIEKEDNVIFAMADRILDIHDQQLLRDAFDKVEAEELGKGLQKKYHAWIEKLSARQNKVQTTGRKQTNEVEASTVDPVIAMAEKALIDGCADEMIRNMTGQVASSIRETFNKALAARKNKDKSAEAAREFVEAYVVYMHCIDGIQTGILHN